MQYRFMQILTPNYTPKSTLLITEIKTQEYHVNLHLLLIFFISTVPHLGVRENNHLFHGFLKNWELNVEGVWWLTKYGPLMDTDSWTYGPIDYTRTA